MNILIVDDSAFMRKALSQMIESDPQLHVIGTARNGEEGLAKAKELRPDVITLDIEMPVMDGLTALARIRREIPEPRPHVIVCSSLTSDGSHEALKALRLGATEVIAKPGSQFSISIDDIRHDLLLKIKALGGAPCSPPGSRSGPRDQRLASLELRQTDIVLIGSSTGGPPVLETIVRNLSPTFPVPVVIAQHMPPLFTKSLAQRLDQVCGIEVVEAESGMKLAPCTVYICPGGVVTRLRRMGTGRTVFDVVPAPDGVLYKPNVDLLFESAADSLRGRAAAVVLTGMGEDGKTGAAALKREGAKIISQDRESCVIYGMPRAVEGAGLSDAVLGPKAIADLLMTLEARGAAAA